MTESCSAATKQLALPAGGSSCRPRPPSAEQLNELLGLLKTVDSVELKLTVPATNARQLMRALGVDPLNAQIRQVVFFDTPDLKLYEAGVVFGVAESRASGDDSTVKLRPVVPDQLSGSLRKQPELRRRGRRHARAASSARARWSTPWLPPRCVRC